MKSRAFGCGFSIAALFVITLPALAEDMARIEGGQYPLGSEQGFADARPAHTVMLAPFLIDRYEVTNAEFTAFLNSLDITPLRAKPPGTVSLADLEGPDALRLIEGPPAAPDQTFVALNDEHSRIGLRAGRLIVQAGYERHPANEVTWYGAVAFCQWRGARLPTEAEWEAAARGRAGRIYPWGNAPPTPERAVYGRRSNQTGPVGTHPAGATPEGIHDLAGNVAEWTSSLYRPYPYDPGDGRENLDTVGERVTRGGDHVYDSAPEELSGFYRRGFSRAIDRGHRHIGFRCARSL